MTILNLAEYKNHKERIVMVTCYDYTFARILNDSDVDMILVGDSAAMVMHGFDTTIPIDAAAMAVHVASVKRGAPDKLIIGDMPFLTFRKGMEPAMDAVEIIIKAGAQAVKLEGIDGHQDLVRHIVDSGVPVMGHVGLTPQSVNQLGGFRVQGRTKDGRERLKRQALDCQQAGCFSLVLECVPETLAAEITQMLDIPTIGIGAGIHTDGQVLVMQDLLGLSQDFKPRFVRTYLDGYAAMLDAFNRYAADVRAKTFPAEAERYEG